ncbi:nucleoside-diphosphate-sugar epimerase [Aspergillus heteromorphus CBS 117.55]|uniref:Nucleoside-diphosphate-sugar epimerase n=1 Tax=Aspergillus heteromorphus CBS 117.55 TaxID=1448321 RepID=A0A317USI9_9EURO|nr:nucleoside-diphosphate-sugar epimerase [Aspergillus heteromorphus CBS 117.55]PWY63030.1 nucleoside-diphosphate-sugar epimerase [Aspergillus heteromorphus CBS 117.55]
MRLILTGATGLVGSSALNQLLALPADQLSRLYILSRKPVPWADHHPNVTVIDHQDFTTYSPQLLDTLKGATGCIWALGVSQTEVNKEDYVKITVDYPLAAAKAFATLADSFNFVYVSGEGVCVFRTDMDPRGGQHGKLTREPQATQTPGLLTPFFGRVKGECEQALLELAREHPSLQPYSVRPAMVDSITDPRVREALLQRPAERTVARRVFRGVVERAIRGVYAPAVSPTPELGRFLARLAMGDGAPLDGHGLSGAGRIISNVAFRREVGL